MSKHHRRRRYRFNAKNLVPIAIIVLLAGLLFYEFRQVEAKNQEYQNRANQAAHTQERMTASWQGQTYYLRNDVQAYALLGIDRLESTEQGGTNPSQCDFAAVIVLDEKAGKWDLLMLNRDTMCNVPVLSAQGKNLGSRHQQLALAHTYGSGSGDSCRNTVQAIQNLLYGVPLNGYVRLSMDSIGQLNDAVGGVTVTLRDDFSEFDETMVPDAAVTLTGEQAELFVRARGGMKDPTNLNRMERQKEYLTGWLQAAREYATQNGGLGALLEQFSGAIYSDLSIYRISELADTAIGYPSPRILSAEGTAVEGRQFIEFNVNENALQQTVIDLFYTLEKE